MTLTPEQCKGARAMLGWSRELLAKSAQVAHRTVVDFERGARQPLNRTLRDIRMTLESAGVIFIDEDDEGPGVRLRKHKR